MPADDRPRGPWWSLFNDPVLDGLMARVEVSNQNLAAAIAAYDQARAVVNEQRAAYFPTVQATLGATRTKNSSSQTIATTDANGVPVTQSVGGRASSQLRANASASWAPDVWGSVRRSVEGARATAQASAATLANARLSAQGELASAYFQLRALDAQGDLVVASIAAYDKAFKITTNRYNAGITARVDVLQAETQLLNARSNGADLARQRALLEHAIAVLVGEAPSQFSLARAVGTKWNSATPALPVGVPSTLLQRRPDVATAERNVAAANAAIGVQQAAFFPSLSLTGSLGVAATGVSGLFNPGAEAWSLGASILQSIFDGGARKARVAQARAAWEQTVAQYRQAVLVAIQQVEDQLAAGQALGKEAGLLTRADAAASRSEQIALNQYLSGQIAYTDVVVAQNTALNARVALLAVQRDRQVAAVALMLALGGDYRGVDTPLPG